MDGWKRGATAAIDAAVAARPAEEPGVFSDRHRHLVERAQAPLDECPATQVSRTEGVSGSASSGESLAKASRGPLPRERGGGS